MNTLISKSCLYPRESILSHLSSCIKTTLKIHPILFKTTVIYPKDYIAVSFLGDPYEYFLPNYLLYLFCSALLSFCSTLLWWLYFRRSHMKYLWRIVGMNIDFLWVWVCSVSALLLCLYLFLKMGTGLTAIYTFCSILEHTIYIHVLFTLRMEGSPETPEILP